MVLSKSGEDRRRPLYSRRGGFQRVIGNTLGTSKGWFGNGEREGGKARTDGMGDVVGEERSHNWKADTG